MQNYTGSQVIIIGGGLAGLAAATRLARAGRQVTLLEKSDGPGGRAVTHLDGGFFFNLGPHALYRKGPAERVLNNLDVPYQAHPVGASGGFAIDGGVKHTLPGGVLSLLTTTLFTLGGRYEAAMFLARLGRLDPETLRGRSGRDWLETSIRHLEVRRFICALVRVSTYVDDMERLDAGAIVAQLQRAVTTGVSYVDGGWQTLIDGLRDAALEAGVDLRTSARAERIELWDETPGGAGLTGGSLDRASAFPSGGGPRGADGRAPGGSQPIGAHGRRSQIRAVVLADGTRLEASEVIVAASPSVAATLVSGANGQVLRRWAEAAIPVKAACLDLGLTRLPQPRATFALGVDAPLYLSVHSRWARVAPENAATVHVAKYLAPGAVPDAKADEAQLEALMDLVQPGWRELVVARRFLPALTVCQSFPQACHGGMAGQPGPEVPGIDGLYVAGDWVGSESLLADAALASADLAVTRVLERAPSARAGAEARMSTREAVA